MTEKERQERAQRFKDLIALPAYQELLAWSANEQRVSMTRIDATKAEDLNVGVVCEERGFRKGLTRVFQEASQRAEGR